MSKVTNLAESSPPNSEPSSEPTAVTPRRGRPRDVRCDHAILQATLDLLVEAGAANLSIDGVAARAGVGKATIYRRWSSKEALVLEALSSDAAAIESPDTGSLRNDLDAYYDGLVERFRASANSDVLPHLIEAACFDAEVRGSLDEYIASRQKPLREILHRGQARGELRDDADIDVIVDLIVGPMMYRRLLTGAGIDRAYGQQILDLVLLSTARFTSAVTG